MRVPIKAICGLFFEDTERFALPNHLCGQKVKETEARPIVAIPINRADNSDQRAIGVGSASADIDALLRAQVRNEIIRNESDEN